MYVTTPDGARVFVRNGFSFARRYDRLCRAIATATTANQWDRAAALRSARARLTYADGLRFTATYAAGAACLPVQHAVTLDEARDAVGRFRAHYPALKQQRRPRPQ